MTLINVLVFDNAFKGVLTLGETILILQLFLQARRPLFAMSFILTQLQMAENGSKEFFEILDLEAKEKLESVEGKMIISEPEIEFDRVGFEYEEGATVLNDLSFKIGKNEKVALVGHSGSGKTTIINLIMRFYEPTEGKIRISGREYKEIDSLNL